MNHVQSWPVCKNLPSGVVQNARKVTVLVKEMVGEDGLAQKSVDVSWREADQLIVHHEQIRNSIK